MENNTKSTPKDVFLHLLGIGTLIVSVVSFITLWFQYINVWIPDALQYYGAGSAYLDSIRWALATLVIVFPVYVLSCWILGRDYKSDPMRREVRARKWLLYLTLFIAAITIIVDLITLLYNYLNGDLTLTFFFKILVVLIVAAGVFGYYIWDLKRQDFKSNKPRSIAWISGLIVLATDAIGFWMVGTPATQRDRRFDETRVNDLQTIENSVTNYWVSNRKLPVSFSDLGNNPIDPQSRAPYEYVVQDKLSYKLCATFKTSVKNSVKAMPQIYPPGPYNESWDHQAGRVCFTRTINPSLYPSPLLKPL